MKRFLTALTGIALFAAVPTTNYAAILNLDALEGEIQENFKTLSEDLGAILSYKALAPAEPLGIIGFDVGAEVTVTQLKSVNVWKKVFDNDDFPEYFPAPKIHAHKGLPFGFDVGLVLSSIPTTDIKFFGAEIRYAIISGNVAIPALAVRGTYTQLMGIDVLDLSTMGVEVTVSKGLLMMTPYAGVGYIKTTSTPHIDLGGVVSLKEESFGQAKFFVGANLNLGLINFAAEWDKTGENNSYSAKVGLRF